MINEGAPTQTGGIVIPNDLKPMGYVLDGPYKGKIINSPCEQYACQAPNEPGDSPYVFRTMMYRRVAIWHTELIIHSDYHYWTCQ